MELKQIVNEGEHETWGLTVNGRRVRLSNKTPTPGALVSWSNIGLPDEGHNRDLARERKRLLASSEGLYLFSKPQYSGEDEDNPNVGVMLYLKFEPAE